MENNHQPSAPKLVPFGHLLTQGILALVSGTILVGLIMSLAGYFLGLVISAIGGCMLAFGLVKHSSSKPREAGLVTFAGSPIHIGGKSVVIGGTTILFPYLGLSTVKVDMDNKDKNFDMTILSRPEPGKTTSVPVKGRVSVTLCPNTKDLEDYNQAGNDMVKIFEQLEDLVYQETQSIVTEKEMTMLQISQEGKNLSDALELKMQDNVFDRRRFGVELIKIRANFPLPETIQNQMVDVEKETYDREAERQEYETMRIAGREFQVELAQQYISDYHTLSPQEFQKQLGQLVQNKTIPNLDECVEKIRIQRLVRDGMVGRIEGGGSNVNIANMPFDFGKKGNKK